MSNEVQCIKQQALSVWMNDASRDFVESVLSTKLSGQPALRSPTLQPLEYIYNIQAWRAMFTSIQLYIHTKKQSQQCTSSHGHTFGVSAKAMSWGQRKAHLVLTSKAHCKTTKVKNWLFKTTCFQWLHHPLLFPWKLIGREACPRKDLHARDQKLKPRNSCGKCPAFLEGICMR